MWLLDVLFRKSVIERFCETMLSTVVINKCSIFWLIPSVLMSNFRIGTHLWSPDQYRWLCCKKVNKSKQKEVSMKSRRRVSFTLTTSVNIVSIGPGDIFIKLMWQNMRFGSIDHVRTIGSQLLPSAKQTHSLLSRLALQLFRQRWCLRTGLYRNRG